VLYLPVARRATAVYQTAVYQEVLEACGFLVTMVDMQPDARTLREKPGLKVAREAPLARGHTTWHIQPHTRRVPAVGGAGRFASGGTTAERRRS
jgi:hypothetical protein